jgi:Ca2+-binding RTX toxin-like protein
MAVVRGTNNSEVLDAADGVTAGVDWVYGDEGHDTLRGLGGGDFLFGEEGRDELHGGAGDDWLDGGKNKDKLFGGADDDRLFGQDGNDELDGGADNDDLDGGEGADMLDGGDGIDTAIYTGSDAGVRVSLRGFALIGQGSSGGDAEGDTLVNIENLTGSNYDDELVGSDEDNRLLGMDGDDLLIGGAGGDHLDGGDGTDTVSYEDSPQGAIITLSTRFTMGGDADGDELTSIENLIGSDYTDIFAADEKVNVLSGLAGDDWLYGYEGDDVLLGGDGEDQLFGDEDNDTLDGGANGDTMEGGTGDDTYFVDDAADEVTELADEGNDTIHSAISYTLDAEVEDLTLLAGAVDGTGNELDNTITGNNAGNTLSGLDGADTLDGGAGVDTMLGGADDDTYYVDTSADVVSEAVGQGFDRILASDHYTLAAGSEVEVLETADPAGTNALQLIGNEFDNTIVGNSGINILAGDLGQDVLIGGMGHDALVGGGGGDVFVWSSTAETAPAGDQADVVTDFNRSEGDLLAVNLIDADGNAGNGDQAFSFAGVVDFGSNQFTGAGQIGYFTTATDTYILLNTVVNPGADGVDYEESTIRLSGVHTVDASWFVL